MNDKEKAFMKEYEALCRKHRMVVHGCGCCGSPFLHKPDPKEKWEENYKRLIKNNVIRKDYAKTYEECLENFYQENFESLRGSL